MPLEKELETYNRKLPELLDEEGKFVLIHGNEVAGVWHTYEDTLQEGYSRFGVVPFLVKRIQCVDEVLHFTRDIPSCPS
jgi:hypothetical protein